MQPTLTLRLQSSYPSLQAARLSQAPHLAHCMDLPHYFACPPVHTLQSCFQFGAMVTKHSQTNFYVNMVTFMVMWVGISRDLNGRQFRYLVLVRAIIGTSCLFAHFVCKGNRSKGLEICMSKIYRACLFPSSDFPVCLASSPSEVLYLSSYLQLTIIVGAGLF